MTKEIDKADFLNLAAHCVGFGIVPTGERNWELAQRLAKQEAIGFNNWLKDNHYTKHPEKGWYKYHENREDFPAGFSMMSPVYEFMTEDEIYELYIKSKQ